MSPSNALFAPGLGHVAFAPVASSKADIGTATERINRFRRWSDLPVPA
jgi:hypothetical protein